MKLFRLLKKKKEKIKGPSELLREQTLRTKTILDSSSNTFLLTLTLDEKISSFNKHCFTYFSLIFNKQIKENINYVLFLKEIISPSRLRLFNIIFNQVKRGEARQFELKLDSQNKEYWLEVFMNPIIDIKGKVVEVSIVAHDITDKKKRDQIIIESLKEKDILLKEVHHRVKNNLQVISSILNLQSSFVKDEKTLGVLQDSMNRIRSMAIIHEDLYRKEDFSSINFSAYLEKLTVNLLSTYRIQDDVVLKVNLENVDLVLEQAIPCGLLMNELITNSLKYAWKQGDKGTITINLKEENNLVYLEIGDDGIGLPQKLKHNQAETLGLQLVATLVEQLDGEIKSMSEKGTKYLIKFEKNKLNHNV